MVEHITFGAWLKRRRQQLDLAQKALAHTAGCSLGTIREIEANERRSSRQLATLIAQRLQIPSDQRETFISFARAKPYSSAEITLPFLTNEAGSSPAPANITPPVVYAPVSR